MDPSTITLGFFNPSQCVLLQEDDDNDNGGFSLNAPIPHEERTDVQPLQNEEETT